MISVVNYSFVQGNGISVLLLLVLSLLKMAHVDKNVCMVSAFLVSVFWFLFAYHHHHKSPGVTSTNGLVVWIENNRGTQTFGINVIQSCDLYF